MSALDTTRFVDVESATAAFSGAVRVSYNLPALLEEDRVRPGAALLVWRQGGYYPGLEKLMADPAWPLAIVSAFPGNNGWRWEAVNSRGDIPPGDFDRILACACGAESLAKSEASRTGSERDPPSPTGNIRATLKIRDYGSSDRSLGGLSWWLAQGFPALAPVPAAAAIQETIANILCAAQAAGIGFFVEEIAMVVSKDPQDGLASITPTLHSDSFYGRRQTAVMSLLERGWDRLGGAVFAPADNMLALWDERPIGLDKFLNQLTAVVPLRTGSGDVMLYDGMLNEYGEADCALGVPHISPDWPGLVSRLVVLMTVEGASL